MMRAPTLPELLGLTAGYVDTVGFLAFSGLFTAHVTGNFVTLGAGLVFGSAGLVAKLLALPLFILVVALVRAATMGIAAANPPIRALLWLQAAMLLAGSVAAWRYAPFTDADAVSTVVIGLVFVAAMAVQNALQRAFLTALPPATLMTGNTTQLVIDLVDFGLQSGARNDERRARLWRLGDLIGLFAIGCAAGAALFWLLGAASLFASPVMIALAAIVWKPAPKPA